MNGFALWGTIALTGIFNAVAGFNDGGNLLACAAASRTIPPLRAFLLVTVGAIVGPLVAGTAVAATIGTGLVDFTRIGAAPLAAAVLGGTVTLLVAFALRLPTSGSVALVGAALGALRQHAAEGAIHWEGVVKVLLSIVFSVAVGFAAGAGVFAVLRAVLAGASRRTGDRLMSLQYLTVALQAVGYGANDAEKMLGLIVAALVATGAYAQFVVPLWAVMLSGGAFALGTALGGLRVARTIGGKLFPIRPLHALSFQAAAAATVLAAAAVGGPLSTTETTASAVLGVGAMQNARLVHWRVAAHIVGAWVLTAPVAFCAGFLAALVIR